MRVTVCQLPDERRAFDRAWARLGAHARDEGSDLVLLPELPFHPWFATERRFDPEVWRAVVEAHEAWAGRLGELGAHAVAGTRATESRGRRYNEGYVWTSKDGVVPVHRKVHLPDEPGVRETSWYHPGPARFVPERAGRATVGFLICSEIWAMERATEYADRGVQLLLSPRLTERASVVQWLAAGKATALLAGAYSLSSNRSARGGEFGGAGWVIDPSGETLATTNVRRPFATVEVDLRAADRAKKTYPRSLFR
jgi:N-carbamoylputrescine amidase